MPMLCPPEAFVAVSAIRRCVRSLAETGTGCTPQSVRLADLLHVEGVVSIDAPELGQKAGAVRILGNLRHFHICSHATDGYWNAEHSAHTILENVPPTLRNVLEEALRLRK